MNVEARFRCAEGHEEVFYNSWACPVCDVKPDVYLVDLALNEGQFIARNGRCRACGAGLGVAN